MELSESLTRNLSCEAFSMDDDPQRIQHSTLTEEKKESPESTTTLLLAENNSWKVAPPSNPSHGVNVVDYGRGPPSPSFSDSSSVAGLALLGSPDALDGPMALQAKIAENEKDPGETILTGQTMQHLVSHEVSIGSTLLGMDGVGAMGVVKEVFGVAESSVSPAWENDKSPPRNLPQQDLLHSSSCLSVNHLDDDTPQTPVSSIGPQPQQSNTENVGHRIRQLSSFDSQSESNSLEQRPNANPGPVAVNLPMRIPNEESPLPPTLTTEIRIQPEQANLLQQQPPPTQPSGHSDDVVGMIGAVPIVKLQDGTVHVVKKKKGRFIFLEDNPAQVAGIAVAPPSQPPPVGGATISATPVANSGSIPSQIQSVQSFGSQGTSTAPPVPSQPPEVVPDVKVKKKGRFVVTSVEDPIPKGIQPVHLQAQVGSLESSPPSSLQQQQQVTQMQAQPQPPQHPQQLPPQQPQQLPPQQPQQQLQHTQQQAASQQSPQQPTPKQPQKSIPQQPQQSISKQPQPPIPKQPQQSLPKQPQQPLPKQPQQPLPKQPQQLQLQQQQQTLPLQQQPSQTHPPQLQPQIDTHQLPPQSIPPHITPQPQYVYQQEPLIQPQQVMAHMSFPVASFDTQILQPSVHPNSARGVGDQAIYFTHSFPGNTHLQYQQQMLEPYRVVQYEQHQLKQPARASTESQLTQQKSQSAPSVPAPPVTKESPGKTRPAAASSSSPSLASKASTTATNGMYGNISLGKLSNFLDQMKSEVEDTDRMIKHLQTDTKIMRDKNKELEAKNRELERKLKEEVALREKAEARCIELRKKLRALTNENGGVQPRQENTVEPVKPTPDGSSSVIPNDSSSKELKSKASTDASDGVEGTPVPKPPTGSALGKEKPEDTTKGSPTPLKQPSLPPAGAKAPISTKASTGTGMMGCGQELGSSGKIEKQGFSSSGEPITPNSKIPSSCPTKAFAGALTAPRGTIQSDAAPAASTSAQPRALPNRQPSGLWDGKQNEPRSDVSPFADLKPDAVSKSEAAAPFGVVPPHIPEPGQVPKMNDASAIYATPPQTPTPRPPAVARAFSTPAQTLKGNSSLDGFDPLRSRAASVTERDVVPVISFPTYVSGATVPVGPNSTSYFQLQSGPGTYSATAAPIVSDTQYVVPILFGMSPVPDAHAPKPQGNGFATHQTFHQPIMLQRVQSDAQPWISGAPPPSSAQFYQPQEQQQQQQMYHPPSKAPLNPFDPFGS